MTSKRAVGSTAKPATRAGGNGKDGKREPAKTPGDILRRSFMEPLGLSAYRVAKEIGVPQITLSQILRGNRGISPAMAVRLGLYFGVKPQFWLALQADHDLSKISGDAEELRVEKCAAMKGQEFRLQPPAIQTGPQVVHIQFQRAAVRRAG